MASTSSRRQHQGEVNDKGIVVVKNLKDMEKAKNVGGGGKCLRTCASIVFSTIGVGAILISYIFCGAILFLTLEGNNEPIPSSATFLHHSNWGNSLFHSQNDYAHHHNQDSTNLDGIRDGKSIVMSLGVQEKRQLRISKELRTKTVNNLWKITEELNILYRENWTALADREMIKFQNELLSGLWLNGGDVKNFEDSSTKENKKSFFASSKHQKRHSKESLNSDLKQPSAPISEAVRTASLGTNQFASENTVNENNVSGNRRPSKRTRNSSRHNNNKIKQNKIKSKSNLGNNKKGKSGDIVKGKYNNGNKNSIFNYRTKKKDGRDASKNSLNKNGLKPENDFIGVTKPASMFVTSSKFNSSISKLDNFYNPSKKLIPNQNNKYTSSKSSSSSLGLSDSASDKDDIDEEMVDKVDPAIKSNQDWSFSSSFLYSLSLITTMGYNGKSPKSSMGKLVAMGLTIVGIPLLMIYLAVVGAGLARTFLRVYCKLCCCQLFCNRNNHKNRGNIDKQESIKLQRTPSNNSGLRIVGSGTNLSLMGDPYIGASEAENTSSVMTTSKVNKEHHPSSGIASGGSLGSFPVHRRESGSMTDVTGDSIYLQQRKCETCSSLIMPPMRSNCSGLGTMDSISRDSENRPFIYGHQLSRNRIQYRPANRGCASGTVPAWILMGVILLYIALGAAVFATYQGWHFVDGLFFSFAVLGTIGIIDIPPSSTNDPAQTIPKYNNAPGSIVSIDSNGDATNGDDLKASDSWYPRQMDKQELMSQAQEDVDSLFVVLCTCYLLIGLAIISMCVQLMEHTCRDVLQRLATTRLMGRHGSWMFGVYGENKRGSGNRNGRYWTTSASESPNNSSSWQGLSRQNSREASVDNLTRNTMDTSLSRSNFQGHHTKKGLNETLMTNPSTPEGGVITSIATTITIGSNPVTTNLNNASDACLISGNQPNSALVGVGETFRPITVPSHQSPSTSQRSQHGTKSMDLSDRKYIPHIDKYTSLPRPSGGPHLSRPSSRASISIPHRTQFGASSSMTSGNNRMNTDSEEALIPPFNPSLVPSTTNEPSTDAMDQLQQLTLRHQMLPPHPSSSLTSTLIKPKPRTGITGLSNQPSESPPTLEYFPSPRPRATLTQNNQSSNKFSSSNLLQPPMVITEGSSSGGSSRRSSSSCNNQQPNQDDLHLNDTLSALDLDYRDLRNLDPNLASSLLEEIKLGADLGPILEKIRASSLPKRASNPTKETKSVTFEDEAK